MRAEWALSGSFGDAASPRAVDRRLDEWVDHSRLDVERTLRELKEQASMVRPGKQPHPSQARAGPH